MDKIKNNLLKMENYIEKLELDEIYDNLFFYKYHSKYLKKLQKTSIDKEDPHYISTYSSFVGEVYENVMYELLLKYALKNDKITGFVLKGPHQDKYKNQKNGLMIDINSQIVYKAGYKDVTEFDGLFFTKDSVYFVESTIVKTTTNLRKRLVKKKALLEVLFPHKKIKALIILTKGALGTSVFPDYCTVWLTDELKSEKLINDLIYKKNTQKTLIQYKDKKFIHCDKIKVKVFKYFDTLLWILKGLRNKTDEVLDFEFLTKKELKRYLSIYSKFYLGYLDTEDFLKVLRYLNITRITEDIPLENIFENKVLVTIEENKKEYLLVYYLKVVNGDLKRLDVNDEVLQVSKKDPKGFTSAETKFLRYVFKNKYKLKFEDLKKIEDNLNSNI
jgi:hypothetical protein